MVTQAEITKRISSVMSDLGFSQRTLARRAGISQSTLSRSLKGDRSLSVDELVDIAGALDVSLAFLTDDHSQEEGFLFAARSSCTDPRAQLVQNHLAKLLGHQKGPRRRFPTSSACPAWRHRSRRSSSTRGCPVTERAIRGSHPFTAPANANEFPETFCMTA